MSMSLSDFSRAEVKATLRRTDDILLGTSVGLYRYALGTNAGMAQPFGSWNGAEVKALGATPDGFLACIEAGRDKSLVRCAADGSVTATLPMPPSGVKALSGETGPWAGTKDGVYRFDGHGWTRVFAAPSGKCEVIGIVEWPGTVSASIKKLGTDERPALAQSTDGGATWSVTACDDYQDIVVAVDPSRIATKWRGARPIGARPGYKKHPITAASLAPAGWAVVDGDKLEIQRSDRPKMSIHHPLMAEAEHLHLVDGGAVFAGPQGAYRLDYGSGAVRDILPPAASGKIKRIYALDDGVLLATATFGTFRSTDGGARWSACDSEWTVLDAEGLVRDDNGRWWLGCQRGVFFSDDNGLRWVYMKPKLVSHHYAEFRGIAAAGDHLCLGTKGGLFIAPPVPFGHMQFVPAFGRTAIEALAWDAANTRLLVGTAAGQLYAYGPLSGRVDHVASLPIHESSILVRGDSILLATDDKVYAVHAGGLMDVTPPGADGEIKLLDLGTGVLAWSKTAAWRSAGGTEDWRAMPGWPDDARHVAHDSTRRRLVVTDRRALHVVPL